MNETKQKRQQQRFVNKETQTAAKYLRRLEELPGAPEAMGPFLDTLRRIYVDMESVDTDRPTVGTYCVMAPQELILAAGAVFGPQNTLGDTAQHPPGSFYSV